MDKAEVSPGVFCRLVGDKRQGTAGNSPVSPFYTTTVSLMNFKTQSDKGKLEEH